MGRSGESRSESVGRAPQARASGRGARVAVLLGALTACAADPQSAESGRFDSAPRIETASPPPAWVDTGPPHTAPLNPVRLPPSASLPVAPGSATTEDAPAINHDVPWTLQVTPAHPSILADGVDSTAVDIAVFTTDGRPAPDGTPLDVSSSLGEITELSTLTGGHATATLRAGTWPDLATVAVTAGYAHGEGSVRFGTGTPTSVQLHLHGSLSEGSGGMLDHIDAATALGVDTLWWTDHDFGYYPDSTYEIAGLDFEEGTLTTTKNMWAGKEITVSMQLPDETQPTLGTVSNEVIADAALSGAYGLRMSGVGADPSVSTSSTLQLNVNPRIHFKSLLAEVSLQFSFRPRQSTSGTELWVTVPLSARRTSDDTMPETYRAVHFVHSDLDYTALNDDENLYVMLSGAPDTWTTVDEDLSTLVNDYWPELREDVHAEFVMVSVVATGEEAVSYDLDDFAWPQALTGDEVRRAQRDFLDTTSTVVNQLIGQEVTFLKEGHFNAFGETLPYFPYADSDEWTARDAVELFHAAGGFVSYNHMFGVEGTIGTDEERAALVIEAIDELLAESAWGCDLLEVGYRSRMGTIGDFLTVWDTLSMADIFITGEGASDAHNQEEWLDAPNNFVTWVPVGVADEDSIGRALKRGDAWFGDPSVFPGGHVDVSLTVPDERARMGQVVLGRSAPATVRFTADWLPAGATVEAVVDGQTVATWTAEADGPYLAETEVDPGPGAVVRFQVAAEADGPILFTNPIWFRSTAPPSLPSDRVPTP